MWNNSENTSGFFRDDGTEIDPELVPKPGLCLLCRNDGDPNEYVPCILNRSDQEGEKEFHCGAFMPR